MSISKKIVSIIDSLTSYEFVVVRAGIVLQKGDNLRDFKLKKSRLHLNHVVPVKQNAAPINIGDNVVIWNDEAILREHAWHAASRELRYITRHDSSFLEIFDKKENHLKDVMWDIWKTNNLENAVGRIFHRIAKINENREIIKQNREDQLELTPC